MHPLKKTAVMKKKPEIGCKRRVMLGKAQIKLIQSLSNKKFRQQHGLYIIEGEKIIHDYIQHHAPISNIYAVEEWLNKYEQELTRQQLPFTTVTEKELERISTLTTPNQAIALVKIQKPILPDAAQLTKGLYLALDAIRDPGNLGTIIRTADWFGVEHVFCSEDCVDAYNPKTVQSAMGSLARVKVHEVPLEKYLRELKSSNSIKIYAAALDGKNMFEEKLPVNALLLIGNESKGLSAQIISYATHQIAIPRFGKAESLNAAVATGVLMAMFRK